MAFSSKNTTYNIYIKRGFFFQKIACFMICLFVFMGLVQSGLQAQSCTTSGAVHEPNPTVAADTLHLAGKSLDGSEIPFTLPPNCPPTGDDDVRNNRGFMIGCNQDCPIAAAPTPSDTVPVYNSSCPLFDIRYKELTSPDDLIFLQYWNQCVGSTLPRDFQASYQGFTNQMFCALDANGYPAAPTTAGASLSGLSSILPTETDSIPIMLTALGFTETCPTKDFNEAELIQADFWVVVPNFVRSLGVQFNGPKDDQAMFMIGPSVSQMCATADFVSSSGGDQGIERLYYNIPDTATQVCGGTLLRARMYISDIASKFSVGPEFDFGGGTFTDIGAGNIYPVTSANDNTHPTLIYDEMLTGFQDGDGNIYDSDLNLVPKGCLVEELDTPPLVCSITGGSTMVMENTENVAYNGPSGMSSYTWSVIAGDATINGLNNGSTVNIDFGTSNSTLQLRITDADGCPSTCTQTISMTSSLTCMISGNTSTCANSTGLTFSGIAGATSYAWTVATGDATIDGAANAQTVTVDAGSNDFTLQLVISPGAVTTCTYDVTVNAPPTCSITGSAMAVENTQDAVYMGPSGMASYAWSITGGDATIDGSNSSQNVSIDFGTNTSTIQLIITDGDGCTSTCTQEVNMTSSLTCMISGSASTCANTTGLTFTGIAGATSYAWTVATGDATIDGAANAQMVTVDAGSNDFTLQLVISPGAVTTCTHDVTVNPLPTCSISGSATAVENTQDALYMGPSGMASYAWSITGGDATIDGSNNSQNVSIDFGTNNSTLQLKITEGNGCTATCTFNITVQSTTTTVVSAPIYTWTFLDPCRCDNPDNIVLADGTFLFKDHIRVDASQYTNPMVSLASADANFLDDSGNPIDVTTATFRHIGGGFFIFPFYTRTEVAGSFVIDVDGDQQSGNSDTCVPCRPTIPTLSQWGLLIYGLLILNLFVGALYRKKLKFEKD